MQIGLGAHKSKYDVRDHKDKELALGVPYPDKYIADLSQLEMRMQYQIGKCVAEASTKKSESLFLQRDKSYTNLSDDFLYLVTKRFVDFDTREGTAARSALKAAQKYGICPKSSFSVNLNEDSKYSDYIKTQIPDQAFKDAQNYKIGRYFQVPMDSDFLKAAIYKYGMIIARFDVDSNWWSPTWVAKDVLPLRPPTGASTGHLTVIYGYDTTIKPGKTLFYMSNSWSKAWADQGNGNFYYEDYKPHLTEAWVATLELVTADMSPSVPLDLALKIFNFLVRLKDWSKAKLATI